MKVFREEEEKQMEEDRALTQKKEGEMAASRELKAIKKKAIEDAHKALLDKFNDPE